MKKTTFLCVLALALCALAPASSANEVFFPGLWQSRFAYPSDYGYKAQTSVAPPLSSNLVESTSADFLDRTPGILMAYNAGNGPSPKANPISGKSWGWYNWDVYAYEGEMFVEEGRTYQFYGRFDDGEALVIDGKLVVYQGNTSGYTGGPAVATSYTAAKTGWVPFNAWIWDWTGGKNVVGCRYALQYNPSGTPSTSYSDANFWKEIVDPGDMSLLRVAGADSYTAISGVTAAENGTDLAVEVSFTDLPLAGTVYACYGELDAGSAAPSAWDHVAKLGEVDAGTSSATWTLEGAVGSKALRLFVEGGAGVANYFTEWTEATTLTVDPLVSLVSLAPGFAGVAAKAELRAFGVGADAADLALEVAASPDGFDEPLATFPFAGNPYAALGAATAVATGLSTDTPYWFRVKATNALGGSAVSEVLSLAISPTAPAGGYEFVSMSGTTATARGVATSLGDSAASVGVRLEAYKDAEFRVLAAASAETTLEEPGAVALSVELPAFATDYYLRVRFANDWGLEAYAADESVRTTDEPPFSPLKVYSPGLVQVRLGSAIDKTTSTADALANGSAAAVPGAIMASTSGSATNPYDGKSYSWGGNTTWAYIGQMYFEAGKTYYFGKYLDDSGYLTVDGAVIMNNDSYNQTVVAAYAPAASGWKDVDFRFGNGGGGAGCVDGTIGFGYNADGVSSFTSATFKDGGPWSKVVDPGDASLLRVVRSETPYFTVGSVAASGDDLAVEISFSDVPEGSAPTLAAYWGAGNGGYDAAGWANSAAVATPAAGDTSAAVYTVPGAGNASFVIFRLADAAAPYLQWSDVFNLSEESPVFGLAVSDVAFTNATFTAACTGLGAGGASARTTLQFSATRDFETVLREEPLSLAGIGTQTLVLNGFETNATYYARVVGENDIGESGASSPVAFTTLEPLAPAGTASFAARGFTTLSASALATDLGFGSSAAMMRVEASADSGFGTLAGVSEEVAATVGTAAALSVPSLAPNTSYYLRVRVVNEWGLATYLPVDGTFSTREAPLSATGIGYAFSGGGATADITFGVTEIFDGATCMAKLEYDGRTAGSQTFSAPGTLSWPGIPAAGASAAATVTVTAVVDGATYTQTWTTTVAPGTESHALSSLSELSSLVFRVGDTATLPELPGANDRYVAMDMRSFSLADDGLSLVALEPGFSAVVVAEWNASGESYEIGARALAVCVPEVEGGGRVFLATAKNMNWEDPSKWKNLTEPDAAPDYPHLSDDVAMAALPGDQVVVNTDVTVAELYFGPNEQNLNTGTEYLTGKNNGTLTFRRSSGEPGLLRFTGLARIDTPVLTGGFTQFQIGGRSGNAETGLGIEMPGGLVMDCGAWPDYAATGTPEVDSFGRARYLPGAPMRYWNIPEGKTLRIVNTYGRTKMTGDDQGGNANFSWGNSGQVTGGGWFVYDGAASACIDNPFYAFEGTVAVRNKQKFDGFSMGSRGGSFWMVNWTRPTQFATNATLLVEGDVAYNGGLSHSSSFGVVSYGNSHGYGSWGKTENAFPAKKWILNGGAARVSGMSNTGWDSPPVAVPNGAGTLVVSNGFFSVQMFNSQGADRPTNVLHFASLRHDGDGTLCVSTDRLRNSAGTSLARDFFVAEGFADHAVGGSGAASYSTTDASAANVLPADAPIVPWIVAPISTGDNLFFPGAAADGTLVLGGWPANSVLNDVADPAANVSVDGTSILLDHDVTVNSLRITNNRNRGRQLGEGRTLTILSGGLVMGGGNIVYFDEEKDFAAGTQGTLKFPSKAYVYSTIQNTSEPNQIWSSIVAPKGAVFSYPGVLRLGGDQTGIDGRVSVNGTRLELGSATTGCEIDVPVHLYGSSARIVVNKAGSFCAQDLYFWDHGTTGAKFEPAAGTQERVHKAYVDGVSVPRGVWGSSESNAENVDDAHFAGTGTVKILSDDLLQPTVLLIR